MKTKKNRRKEPSQVKRPSLGRLRRWFWASRWKVYTFFSTVGILFFLVLWFTLHPLYWLGVAINCFENLLVDGASAIGFRVKDIYLQGRQNLPLHLVGGAINIKMGDPIFAQSPSQVQASLQNIPWIEKVHVKRMLPDRLFINIHERAPVALWQMNGRHHLIDQSGVVITNADLKPFMHLPIVVGEKARDKISGFLYVLKKFPKISKHITGIIYVSERRWDIQLDRKATVKLPESQEEAGLKRLDKILQSKKLDLSDIETIDLRMTQHYILKVKPAAKIRVTKKAAVA